ncbi:cobyrinate a,c-diamide synthase [Aestuariibius insulae]|uniref:cobyrinate a,c-diamide synthase n=1 Tax=Aestuariibius insulae TaxID=2058287 RepID=UPI00345F0FDC
MSSLIVTAPASGSGKTTVTLGLLRAYARRGEKISGAKSGPDYIDPRFHEAACGAPCLNLDTWAMSESRIRSLAAGEDTLIVEGAMGLFDGAPPDGRGSSSDLARLLGLPVLLVVDAGRMSQSVAALVQGFLNHDPSLRFAGIVLNRVGSPRHDALLRQALATLPVPVLGSIPRRADLAHPSRHLGLVQAGERADLDRFIEATADLVEAHIDLDALGTAMTRAAPRPATAANRFPPPGQIIAMAGDKAFAFAYPHLLSDWRSAGAEIRPFSPLANDAVPEADIVILPGGYPELHAGRLAGNATFMDSLRSCTAEIYGECGGYMVLGETLTDARGTSHRMAGHLKLRTSFAERRLHLGYRRVSAQAGPFKGQFSAHEFHYATTLSAKGTPLFDATDAEGTKCPAMGLIQGRVSGSFAHLIDVLP